jgi:OmcA/MtrC family decaheme c-type cytochrome
MNVSSSWGTRILGCVWALFAMAILAGCTGGKDGTAGPAGPTGPQGPGGSTGPSGPVLALDISTAKSITAKITSVTSGTTPTITFTLVDETGNPLKGLTNKQISIAIAQLQPAAAGGTQQWRSYVTQVETATPGTLGWGTHDAVQPKAEAATAGTFVDKGDGSYTYQFSKPLDALAADANAAYAVAGRIPTGVTVPYDGTLTHRVALELRAPFGATALNPTNNAVYDYIPATGSTTLTVTHKVSSNKECDACHAKLAMHGGPRIDVEYCVVCHNSGNADAQSGNTLDMKVLAHKVHSGAKLPSVVADTTNKGMVPAAGIGYVIYGYGGSVNNFNEVVWPQDVRNCTTCHNTADPNTTEAGTYATNPTAAACGACHDNIDFTAATVVKHAGVTGPIADTDCMNSGCHSATSPGVAAVGGGKVDIVTAHSIVLQTGMAKYKLNVARVLAYQPDGVTIEAACQAKINAAASGASVVCTVPPGDYPAVAITVTDPTNGNAAYDLTAAPFNVIGTSFSARAAWTTQNYTNPGAIVGSGTVQAQSVSFFGNCSGVDVTKPNNCAPSTTGAIPAPATTATNTWGSVYWDTVALKSATNTTGRTSANFDPTLATTASLIPSVPAIVVSADKTMLTARFPYPVPASRTLAGGSGAISAQGTIQLVNVADVGKLPTKISNSSPAILSTALPIRSADPVAFPITDTKAVARRQVVDYNNCLRCHKKLVLHGSRVDNVQFCVVCHNPAQAPRVQLAASATVLTPAPGSAGSEPVDFKFFIHGVHAAKYKAGLLDYTDVGFPGALNNCLGCHKTDTYYPVDPANVFGTTIDPGQTFSMTLLAGYDDPTKHYAITANAAACGSCHVDAAAQTHMKQQGAVVIGDLVTGGAGMNGLAAGAVNTFVAGAPHIKALDGSTLPQYQTETCSVCHGPGATADVKVVHGVASFKYN